MLKTLNNGENRENCMIQYGENIRTVFNILQSHSITGTGPNYVENRTVWKHYDMRVKNRPVLNVHASSMAA